MKEKIVERTIVGWGVILIFLWISLSFTNNYGPLGGDDLMVGLAQALFLFFLSIVCTAGVSLIIWIPLGYGVGWIVFKLAGWDRAFHKKLVDGTRQPELQSTASLTRDQQALVNYIKKAKEKGLPNHQITQNLTNNGWAIDNIATAFQMARNGA